MIVDASFTRPSLQYGGPTAMPDGTQNTNTPRCLPSLSSCLPPYPPISLSLSLPPSLVPLSMIHCPATDAILCHHSCDLATIHVCVSVCLSVCLSGKTPHHITCIPASGRSCIQSSAIYKTQTHAHTHRTCTTDTQQGRNTHTHGQADRQTGSECLIIGPHMDMHLRMDGMMMTEKERQIESESAGLVCVCRISKRISDIQQRQARERE